MECVAGVRGNEVVFASDGWNQVSAQTRGANLWLRAGSGAPVQELPMRMLQTTG